MSGPYSIAFVERSTGISRETLRVWERRYGFPAPQRDAAGDRSYSTDDLDRLRVIKRLLDQGYRPGKVVPLPVSALSTLTHPGAKRDKPAPARPGYIEFLDLLLDGDALAAQDWLHRRLSTDGLATFVTGTMAPLTDAVGDAWAEGRLGVHDEHLFSELAQRVLRQAIAALPRGDRPRMLLTTLPEELHGLGLLMAEALCGLQGARCLNLGVSTPAPDVLEAARRHDIDIIALSFSPAYPRRRIVPQLQALRAELPAAREIWAGGRITRRMRPPPGVSFCPTLDDAVAQLARWRAAHGPGAAD
jgi:methylmalonyl-CoA mutase cobalamin-binding subunit